MRKLVALIAIMSFAVGLNATTKEEIYNTNPTQFDELKNELQQLYLAQTEKQKQTFIKEEIQKVVKNVFSNKEIVRNYNSAVIKNGKVIKVSKDNEEDGILFWHEHSVPNAPEAYTCRVYDPSFDNVTLNTPCGVLKYQMLPSSPYANEETITPMVSLLEDNDTNVNDIETYPLDEITYTPMSDFNSIQHSTNLGYGETVVSLFRDNQIINDTILFSAMYTDGDAMLYKPLQPSFYFFDDDLFPAYYVATEYNNGGGGVMYTLKSGNYIQLLTVYYSGDVWYEYYVILKWFRVRVENYYLGDVGIRDNDKNKGAQIVFNNREIKITLDDSINPASSVYELYDLSGKLIDRKALFSQETTLNMPSVSSGVYIVRVKGKNLSVSKKISFVK